MMGNTGTVTRAILTVQKNQPNRTYPAKVSLKAVPLIFQPAQPLMKSITLDNLIHRHIVF